MAISFWGAAWAWLRGAFRERSLLTAAPDSAKSIQLKLLRSLGPLELGHVIAQGKTPWWGGSSWARTSHNVSACGGF